MNAQHLKTIVGAAGVIFFAAGCSGGGASIADAPNAGHDADADAGAAAVDAGTSGEGDAGAGGPTVAIHVLGSVAPVAHADDLASQTPSIERVGIRSLRLFRDETDTTGITVFDLGANPMEASLADEADTLVAEVPASSLTAGRFTVARVGVSLVRYRVAATVHGPATVAGELDTVQALSDGAVIDGSPRSKGYFQSTFTSGSYTFGPTSGQNPVPKIATAGGIRLDDASSESAYVFPVDVLVDPQVTHDVRVDFTVNVFEDFRWEDQTAPGYATGIFDTTASTYEPVMSFGASAFHLTMQ